MGTSDYVLVFTSLFLGACALFVPYLAEIIKRKAFAPNLKILFEHAVPFCHKTILRTMPGTIREPVYYFRFQVVNEGKTQARLCEAVLENLWIYDAAGNPQRYPNFSPVNMPWVGIEAESLVDINPKRRFYCDIGYISSPRFQREIDRDSFIDVPGYKGDGLRFKLSLLRYFFSQPNCLGPGKYVLQIGLYSENAGYQKEFFDISWSGEWRESHDEMFREIVVARTKGPT